MPNSPTFTSSSSRLRQSGSAYFSVALSLAFLASSACKTNEEPGNGEPLPPAKTGGKTGTGGNKATGGSGGSTNGGSGGNSGGAGGTDTDGGGRSGGSGGSTGDGGVSEVGSSDTSSETGGDGGTALSLFVDPLAPLPTKLSDTGLFTALPDLTKVHPRAFLFEPRYPLWSNGLGKIRHAVIPEGKKINSTGAARQNWDFPIGTLFFKTFTQDPAPGGKARPVETRLIRRVKDAGPVKEQWEMVVYQWNAQETDAVLLDNPNIAEKVMVSVGGKTIGHNIPSRANCQQCHVANFTQIIGFDELRLNGKLSPAAAKTQLQEVIDKGWLTTPPIAPLADITDTNAERRWVREYMHANCGHCHNGGMPLENIARIYDLRHSAFIANTVNQMVVGRSAQGMRVLPGRPDESVLYLAFMQDTTKHPDLKPMPFVGVEVIDQTAAMRLRAWIMSLPRQ